MARLGGISEQRYPRGRTRVSASLRRICCGVPGASIAPATAVENCRPRTGTFFAEFTAHDVRLAGGAGCVLRRVLGFSSPAASLVIREGIFLLLRVAVSLPEISPWEPGMRISLNVALADLLLFFLLRTITTNLVDATFLYVAPTDVFGVFGLHRPGWSHQLRSSDAASVAMSAACAFRAR